MQIIKLVKKVSGVRGFNTIEKAMKIPECQRIPVVKNIEKIVIENESTRTFFFNYPQLAEMANPGQFIMLGVFHKIKEEMSEEIPLSLSYVDKEKGIIGVTVKHVPPPSTTDSLFKHSEGDEVTIRGPYGKGFDLKGSNVSVVGGGIGIAPLAYLVEELVKKNIKVTVFLGGKSASELLFIGRIRNTGVPLILSTEDGSIGSKGTIDKVFGKYIKHFKFDHVYCCGRERMMKKILKICLKYSISAQFSLERYIKCGRGVCGHCAIDGYRVCTDGPVFPIEIVKNLKDFGKRQLDEDGAVVELRF
jgi:dihydroorotate dehydrogenase electron transfer subunit